MSKAEVFVRLEEKAALGPAQDELKPLRMTQGIVGLVYRRLGS